MRKPFLCLLLTAVLVLGLLPVTALAAPSFDSEETLYFFVGQQVGPRYAEAYDLIQFSGLTPSSSELIWGDVPDWFGCVIEPDNPYYHEPGGCVYYGGKDSYVLQAADKGTWTYWLRVSYRDLMFHASSQTDVHKVTLIVQDEPHADYTRTIQLPKDGSVHGDGVIPPGAEVKPEDIAFPLPDNAWKQSDSGSWSAYVNIYTLSGTMPNGLTYAELKQFMGNPYIVPETANQNCGYYDGTPTKEGVYDVWFRVRPTRGGAFFRPFT